MKKSIWLILLIVLVCSACVSKRTDFSEKVCKLQKINEDNPAMLYYLGQEYFLRKEYDKALEYWQRSAEKNYIPAYTPLGSMYVDGYGIKQDFSRTKYWYERGDEELNSKQIL